MYKRASRAMIHATRVNAPLPTGGYIGSLSDVADILPDVSHLGTESLRVELAQLRAELRQCEQKLSIAKASGTSLQVKGVGQQKVTLCSRIQAVKLELTKRDGPNEMARLMKAAREIVGDDVLTQIVARSREMRTEFEHASVAQEQVA